MIIRKATKRDIVEIVKLMLEEFKKPPFNERASLKYVLKSLNFYFKIGTIYIATYKKEIISVLVFKIEQWWEGPVIIIEDLAVKGEFKKRKIDRIIMNKLEYYAKKNKIKKIIFDTNIKSPSIRLFKRFGYKHRKDIISMEKRIR